jgi:hypothetical protein
MEKTCGNCRWADWETLKDADFGCESEGQCTNKKAIALMPDRMVGVGYDYDCPEWMPKLRPCPKCGETKIELNTWYCGDCSQPVYRYGCKNGDEWDAWFDTPEEAASDWNQVPGVLS